MAEYESDNGSEHSDDDLSETGVDIGILNEIEETNEHYNNLKLTLKSSSFFPCKIGGKPQWLHFDNLPTNLNCDSCKLRLSYLMQVYAPLNNNNNSQSVDANAFHRYLFVFLCANSDCNSRTVRVYRTQMGRSNDIYSEQPPPSFKQPINELNSHLIDFHKRVYDKQLNQFCNVCGFPCSKKCSQCKFVFYCSEVHQKLDWGVRKHKELCKKYGAYETLDEKIDLFVKEDLPNEVNVDNKHIFPEFEILIEPELEESDTDEPEMDQEKIERELEANKELSDDLETMPESEIYDKDFDKFKKRIRREPKQVIRYERGGQPLWCTKVGKLTENKIPNCELCNSKRVFEFQITPQLLNYLKLDSNDLNVKTSLDWAGIYIFTCEANCSPTNYATEFAYKQDYA